MKLNNPTLEPRSHSRVYPYKNLVIESWEPSDRELLRMYYLLQQKNTIYRNKTT